MDTLLASQVISISKANAFVLDVVQEFAIAHLTESNFFIHLIFSAIVEFDVEKWKRKVFKVYKGLLKTEK